MSRRNGRAAAPLGYACPSQCVTTADVRVSIKGLRLMAETLMAEISRLEAEVERMEADGPLPVPPSGPLVDEMRRLEAALIRRALAESGANTAEAARRLGIKPNRLHYKIRRYGLRPFGEPGDR